LIPAGDAEAGAEALAQLGSNEKLRDERIRSGNSLVRAATMQVECARAAEFIAGA
jgi:hypothetical protein